MSYDALVYVSTCLTMHVYLCAYEGGVWSTYQMRCRPLGIARTALTVPLTLGNLNVRRGSRRLLCRLYSSTVPFRRPA